MDKYNLFIFYQEDSYFLQLRRLGQIRLFWSVMTGTLVLVDWAGGWRVSDFPELFYSTKRTHIYPSQVSLARIVCIPVFPSGITSSVFFKDET